MNSSMTPENEFMLHLLQRVGCQHESDLRLETIAKTDPDWNTIIELASRHCLESVLRRTLADIEATPPVEISQTLDKRHREVSFSNLTHSQQLHNICDLFNAHDIAAVPYKGPVLTEVAYGGVGHRRFGDLDILVTKDDVKAACALLEQQGYERVNFPDIPVETLISGTPFRWGREFRFVDSNGGLPVELRFGFVGGRRSGSTIIEDFCERRTTTSVAGQTVQALSPEDRVLLLLVHGTKHGWRRLSWVYDVALLIQNNINWQAVLARAKEYRWRRATLYGLAVTAELTKLSVPDPIRANLGVSRMCSWGAQQTVQYIQNNPAGQLQHLEPMTTALYLNDTMLSTVVDLTDEAFSPRKADYELIRLPVMLYSLYYLVRMYRLGRNRTKQLIR